ncbi:MAG: hypothetical protein GY842_14895 [bacterium]|nr:hypothetical protein [bacterium]
MTQATPTIDVELDEIRRRVGELRQSFDDDIRYAPQVDSAEIDEFLLLTLCGEAYAFPVIHALEILQVPTVVPVPRVPASVLGIMNFRGQILSVTTINALLGLPAGERGPDNRIIVTKGLNVITGILVDGVAGIIQVVAEEVQFAPATMGDDKARLVLGETYMREQLVSLLDVEQLCASDSLGIDQTDRIS